MTTVEVGKLVGTSVARKEDRPLITGQGRFVADLKLPGTLDVAFVRSPVAHAKIARIDTTRALAAPGVKAIYTGEDIRGLVAPFTRFVDQEHTPPGLAAAVQPQIHPCPIEVLVDGTVRYVGQAIVAVVSTDRYLAEDACELVEIDYDELPVVSDVHKAIEPDSPLVHDGIPGNVQADFVVRAGDPDAAFESAPHTKSMRFRTQRVTGHPMETRGVVAHQTEPGRLSVWSSTQTPYMVRTRIAEQLGMAEQDVRVVAPHVGGGFGPKVQVYPEEVLLAHIARQIPQPIRWIEDRREHLMTTAQARDQVHFLDVAFDDEGLILAIKDEFLLDAGAYNPFSITCAYNTAAHIRSLFKIPHAQIRGRCVLTNKTFNVPYRGAGRPEGAFAIDRAVYEVARELGLDPAQVMRRNLIEPQQMPYPRGMPYRDGNEIVYEEADYPAAFDDLLERVGFAEHKATQAAGREGNKRRGIGFATYIEGTGIGPFESASVGLRSDGSIQVRAGCTPHGQSHETVFSQVVADVLGVGVGDVDFRGGDTNELPYGVGTFASRSAVVAGSAIQNSAVRLRERLRQVASDMLEVDPSDIELADGAARVRGAPESSVDFVSLYAAGSPGPFSKTPDGDLPGTTERDFWVPPTVTWGFGLQAAVVEVDIDTGFVEVEKMVVIHDCGRLLNPLVVEGQVDGGVVQGIGAALYEEIVHDDQAQPLTTTLMDYLLPTSAEVPPIEQVHLESVSQRNPLGVKGVGEAGTISPPAAIANAVYEALAYEFNPDIFDLPLSPAKVAAAIWGE